MEDFDDFRCTVEFGNCEVEILRCPEDKTCKCGARHRLCSKCQVPVCRECASALRAPGGPTLPAAALANDLMIFYAPKEL